MRRPRIKWRAAYMLRKCHCDEPETGKEAVHDMTTGGPFSRGTLEEQCSSSHALPYGGVDLITVRRAPLHDGRQWGQSILPSRLDLQRRHPLGLLSPPGLLSPLGLLSPHGTLSYPSRLPLCCWAAVSIQQRKKRAARVMQAFCERVSLFLPLTRMAR